MDAKHTCSKQDAIDDIRQDIKEIKRDIRELLTFKYQILGATMIVSILVSIAISYISKMK